MAAVFIATATIQGYALAWWPGVPGGANGMKALLWLGAMVVSLPMLIAVLRKLQAAGILVGELSVARSAGRRKDRRLARRGGKYGPRDRLRGDRPSHPAAQLGAAAFVERARGGRAGAGGAGGRAAPCLHPAACPGAGRAGADAGGGACPAHGGGTGARAAGDAARGGIATGFARCKISRGGKNDCGVGAANADGRQHRGDRSRRRRTSSIPVPDEELQAGDVLLLLGTTEQLDRAMPALQGRDGVRALVRGTCARREPFR